ncbi:MAG: hypothetical protein EZS28_042673, partial [Streblomastix strix]
MFDLSTKIEGMTTFFLFAMKRVNLFANVVARGQARSQNLSELVSQQKVVIQNQEQAKQLIKETIEIPPNNNIEIDDNELEITAPQDPVIWKDLLKHMDIEWNKIKYYNEKEQEKQDKLKLKQEKEKGKEKTRKMLEEILIQQTIKEEEEKGKKEGTILEEWEEIDQTKTQKQKQMEEERKKQSIEERLK